MSRVLRSRRAFLGTLGAAIALPWLPSVHGARAEEVERARLLWIYLPNGMVMSSWTPFGTGPLTQLSPILTPLARHQQDLLVLSGLSNEAVSSPLGGPHPRGTAGFLTCSVIGAPGAALANGRSADQVYAEHVRGETPFRSLELGLELAEPTSCPDGYSCAYSRNISWVGAQPVAKSTRPERVFDRLMSGFDPADADWAVRRAGWRATVLDDVTREIADLQARLSAGDRARLDQYLTGVREVESRLLRPWGECATPRAPGEGLEYPDELDAMSDMIGIAFGCDLTRVATFMFENAQSNRTHGYAGAPGPHHILSHHGGDESSIAKLENLGRFYMERVAYLLDRLAEARDPDGVRVLDRTIVCVGSELSDGDRHSLRDLPILLAGGSALGLHTARHLAFPGEPPLASLHAAMLAMAGAPVEGFGPENDAPLGL